MTDKEQIMIDKVDVSKCFWLWVNTDKNYKSRCIMNKDVYSQCTYCKDHPNCLFKQLARKTQECEELKDYARRQENQRETYYKEYLKLSHECEELKEQLTYLMEYRKKNQTCTECYEDGYNVGRGENKELARYRKALKEIEGIVTKDYYDNNWADITIKIDSIRNIVNKAKDINVPHKKDGE